MRYLPPTRSCKICFKTIKETDFCRIFNSKIAICGACQKEMNPKYISFKINTYDGLSIYDYNPFIRQLIYQYKGCYDYELFDVFINSLYTELKLHYLNYALIPIPSFKNDDEERGFNHVKEIFKNLGLKTLDILEKTEKHKQATSSVEEREKVYKVLALKEKPDLRKTKVLIVDDIYTTGATMKSAINLLEKLNPKAIKVLVIAKTKPKQPIN